MSPPAVPAAVQALSVTAPPNQKDSGSTQADFVDGLLRGNRSEAGRDCGDGFVELMHTSRKLGISVWGYLGDRLALTTAPAVQPLRSLIRRSR